MDRDSGQRACQNTSFVIRGVTFRGQLASVYNGRENSGIIHQFIDPQPDLLACMWTAGSDERREGSWLWTDGSSFGFTNWIDGSPSRVADGKNCLAIRPDGLWRDFHCTDKMSAGDGCTRIVPLCELSLAFARRTVTATSVATAAAVMGGFGTAAVGAMARGSRVAQYFVLGMVRSIQWVVLMCAASCMLSPDIMPENPLERLDRFSEITTAAIGAAFLPASVVEGVVDTALPHVCIILVFWLVLAAIYHAVWLGLVRVLAWAELYSALHTVRFVGPRFPGTHLAPLAFLYPVVLFAAADVAFRHPSEVSADVERQLIVAARVLLGLFVFPMLVTSAFVGATLHKHVVYRVSSTGEASDSDDSEPDPAYEPVQRKERRWVTLSWHFKGRFGFLFAHNRCGRLREYFTLYEYGVWTAYPILLGVRELDCRVTMIPLVVAAIATVFSAIALRPRIGRNAAMIVNAVLQAIEVVVVEATLVGKFRGEGGVFTQGSVDVRTTIFQGVVLLAGLEVFIACILVVYASLEAFLKRRRKTQQKLRLRDAEKGVELLTASQRGASSTDPFPRQRLPWDPQDASFGSHIAALQSEPPL